MIAKYSVKRNGKWYRAGEEVPEGGAQALSNAAEDAQALSEEEKKRRFTKTEIARMPVEELRKLAIMGGLENAASMTGNELKQYFISLYEL